MNIHELPMIIFTVVAQMCVGTFIVLGVIQFVARRRHNIATVERLTEPIVYAIGPAMVFGLAASTLHMNDVSNVFNVFLNVGSSWLSREIVFGMLFAGLGFAFALLQWFKVGSFLLRQIVAVATALAGIGLIWTMASIYSSLETVPAWNTPIVPFHFYATALMLGALATACALMITAWIRHRSEKKTGDDVDPGPGSGGAATEGAEPSNSGGGALATMVLTRIKAINKPTTSTEWALTTRTVQLLAVTAAVVGVAVMISYPIHFLDLATTQAGQAAAEVFSGGFFIARLILLGLSTVVLAFFVYRTASHTVQQHPQLLTGLITFVFVLAVIAEFMGRSLHYDSLVRIGI